MLVIYSSSEILPADDNDDDDDENGEDETFIVFSKNLSLFKVI